MGGGYKYHVKCDKVLTRHTFHTTKDSVPTTAVTGTSRPTVIYNVLTITAYGTNLKKRVTASD